MNGPRRGRAGRQFGLFRAVALWVVLTYVCVYWLARDPCLARGGVLTTFVCGTDDGKVFSIIDLATVPRVAIAAVAVGVVVAVVWRLLRKVEIASRND